MADTAGPRHVAIIMDGNGRWAAARGLPRAEGHRRGVEALRRTVRAAGEYDQGPGARIWLTPEKGRIHRFDQNGRTIRNAA